MENLTAGYIWANHEYTNECVKQKGPLRECQERFDFLTVVKEDTAVANESQKIGRLPKSAVKKLKAELKELGK